MRHVAFLRGINLGSRRLKMEELRRHFEALDVEDAVTYLASGNVIFDRPGAGSEATGDGETLRPLEERIESHLADALGYEVDTFVRPMTTLHDLLRSVEDGTRAEDGPPGRDPLKPHVIFLRREIEPGEETALRALETPADRFPILGREVLWLRWGRLSDSSIEPRHLDEALNGRTHTMRTLNTVRRIVKKFGG